MKRKKTMNVVGVPQMVHENLYISWNLPSFFSRFKGVPHILSNLNHDFKRDCSIYIFDFRVD